MTNDPVVRNQAHVPAEPIPETDGLKRADLLSEEDGVPSVELRRYVVSPGVSVPKHTNTIEHEQYVLEGEYALGIDETEHVVGPGDVVFIPAGTPHWYRNDGDSPAEYLCIVPLGDEGTEFLE